jgi:hypothetical protein
MDDGQTDRPKKIPSFQEHENSSRFKGTVIIRNVNSNFNIIKNSVPTEPFKIQITY